MILVRIITVLFQIFVRIKCTVTERGRVVNLKQANFKSIKISGKIHQNTQKGAVFIGVASPVECEGVDRQELGVFTSKHSLDMKFTDIEDRYDV